MRTEIMVCGKQSPHAPQKLVKNGWEQNVRVSCNRPAGHDGNHAWSTDQGARQAEWTPAGEVVR